MKYRILVILLWIGMQASAQSGRPRGYFVQDTISIGQPLSYILYYHHNKDEQLLFPDTNYSFKPFELINRTYFPTRTQGEQSMDSVVYHLRTFALDSQQFLSLPVYIIKNTDTLSYFPDPDSIVLFRQIKNELNQDIVLKANQELETIEPAFNYYYFAAWIFAILIIAAVLYLTLGKTFVRRYRLIQIRSAHMNFIRAYEMILRQFALEPDPASIEVALALWKEYLGKLEEKPINTYTTTEIITLYNREDLMLHLQVIDRSIYGGIITEEVNSALTFLKSFSNRKFLERKKEVTNG